MLQAHAHASKTITVFPENVKVLVLSSLGFLTYVPRYKNVTSNIGLRPANLLFIAFMPR